MASYPIPYSGESKDRPAPVRRYQLIGGKMVLVELIDVTIQETQPQSAEKLEARKQMKAAKSAEWRAKQKLKAAAMESIFGHRQAMRAR